jgi:1,4-alpha-glucan branching enzyme
MKPLFLEKDPWLAPFEKVICQRLEYVKSKEKSLTAGQDLVSFASGHLYYGLHFDGNNWYIREWAPHATEVYLVGDFSGWKVKLPFAFRPVENGNWELVLPANAISHGQLYKLFIRWHGGEAYRLPAYGRRMVQDPVTHVFNAQVWMPQQEYIWKSDSYKLSDEPLMIYEAHVGMSSPEERIASFTEFRDTVIPRIKKAGYNMIQLMAIQEHPYYGSFGYHVSNFFAVSSRFGTPEDLKSLVDTAHQNGIGVIMDIIHSHSVKNVDEGLALFDGTPDLYFPSNPSRREHPAWDSLCFDYGKPQVLHFLLSNCKYWLEEFRFDGFRFDGVTSMLYYNHGLGKNFTNYEMYYDGGQDIDAIAYLTLANKLIHKVNPRAVTIAEEMSGMPGLATPLSEGGMGFDYRMAMGMPDYWIKIIKELPDEQWNVNALFHEASTRRVEEKTVTYAESHDQALVGDKTIAFRLMDKEMYFCMSRDMPSLVIDRGMALHKMIRLFTASAGGNAYLNFMGNEFGHPEWIDFPREGNGWSYKHARRLWHLADDNLLRYSFLRDFDEAMIRLLREWRCLADPWSYKCASNEIDQVILYRRGGLYFVFNFHPTQSYTDYPFPIQDGSYRILLNSDNRRFGGFGRIDEEMEYKSIQGTIKLYLPNRTAFVLTSEKSPALGQGQNQ